MARGYRKFKNNISWHEGQLFHSDGEYNRYCELVLLERAGEIFNLSRQPEFVILDTFRDCNGRKHAARKYIADFQYQEEINGRITIEDFKGVKTAVYTLKRDMFLSRYPQYLFVESKAR